MRKFLDWIKWLVTPPEPKVSTDMKPSGFVFEPNIYKIIPVEPNQFRIERAYTNRPETWYPFQTWKHGNWRTEYFASKTQAEECVKDLLEAEYESQLKDYNKKQWVKNNPPYIYNPEHSRSK